MTKCFYFENVVVGGNLEAIIFASVYNYPIIFSKLSHPHPTESFKEKDSRLTILQINQEDNIIKTNNGDVMVFGNKCKIFDELLLACSMGGQILSNKVKQIVLEKDKLLRLLIENNHILYIEFEHLYTNEPQMIKNVRYENKNDFLDIYDNFELSSKIEPIFDFVELEESDFCGLWFSQRNITLQSKIREHKVNDLEFSIPTYLFSVSEIIRKHHSYFGITSSDLKIEHDTRKIFHRFGNVTIENEFITTFDCVSSKEQPRIKKFLEVRESMGMFTK